MKRGFERREVPTELNMRLTVPCMNWYVSSDFLWKLCLLLVTVLVGTGKVF